MKIAILCRAYPPDIGGGGEISTRLLAEGLAVEGQSVHVVTFGDRSDPGPPENVGGGLTIHRLPPPRPYRSLRCIGQPLHRRLRWHAQQNFGRPPASVLRRLEAIGPDVVHTSTVEDFGFGVWRAVRRTGVPVIHTLRSWVLMHAHGTLFDNRRRRNRGPDILTPWRRRAADHVDGVVGLSRSILDGHRSRGFFPHAAAAVIGNPAGLNRRSVRRERSPNVRLGYLGRLSVEKGVVELCRAASGVDADGWELNIAGDGPETLKRRMREAAGGAPVRWVGRCDAAEFLSNLDALIVPSLWHEPFGRIIVEAHSMGIPVACLRRGGMPELVDPGVNGWILDRIDAASVDRVRREFGRFTRRDIVASASAFTVSRIARQYLAFYRTVLDRRDHQCRPASRGLAGPDCVRAA